MELIKLKLKVGKMSKKERPKRIKRYLGVSKKWITEKIEAVRLKTIMRNKEDKFKDSDELIMDLKTGMKNNKNFSSDSDKIEAKRLKSILKGKKDKYKDSDDLIGELRKK